MVVLKDLIFNSLIWEGVVVLKEPRFIIVYPLGGCGGLERTKFELYPLWEGMVVLKN